MVRHCFEISSIFYFIPNMSVTIHIFSTETFVVNYMRP